MEPRDEIKFLAAAMIEMESGIEPGKFGAFDWRKALDQMDETLSSALPLIGPLMPVQMNALATLIAKAIHIGAEKTATES